MSMDIRIEKTKNFKTKPDQNNLGFGKYFTDHMFIMDYNEKLDGMTLGLSPMARWTLSLQPRFFITPRPFLKD